MPSTVIRAIAYREAEAELEVLFTTGHRYIYHAVPPAVAEAFRVARIARTSTATFAAATATSNACKIELPAGTLINGTWQSRSGR